MLGLVKPLRRESLSKWRCSRKRTAAWVPRPRSNDGSNFSPFSGIWLCYCTSRSLSKYQFAQLWSVRRQVQNLQNCEAQLCRATDWQSCHCRHITNYQAQLKLNSRQRMTTCAYSSSSLSRYVLMNKSKHPRAYTASVSVTKHQSPSTANHQSTSSSPSFNISINKQHSLIGPQTDTHRSK